MQQLLQNHIRIFEVDHSHTFESDQKTWNLDQVVQGLQDARAEWRLLQGKRCELPSRNILKLIVSDLRGVLFPLRQGPPNLTEEAEDYYVGHTLTHSLNTLKSQVILELRQQSPKSVHIERAGQLVQLFAEALPQIRRTLDRDVEAAFRGDPSARSTDEVLVCFPGIQALILHRLAHRLYELGLPLISRMIAEISHSDTGIDIHPGARIGPGCFIDHGTGVVIGETAIIGEEVRIYQAVTLGAKSFPQAPDGSLVKGLPRHPIVEDRVVIYSGATILGRVTIGRDSIIGGNVWLTADVPPQSVITQAGLRNEVVSDGLGI